jgi:glycerol-3-phosphate acyltransferase PlsX
MGGDFAPDQSCLGIQRFLEADQFPDAQIVAYGTCAHLESLQKTYSPNRLEIIPTTDHVEMDEHPTKVYKEKPGSAFALGFSDLSQSKIDSFISAGNTGAMLVGATMIVKPINGVSRPTIPTIVPCVNGKTGLLLDVGINADCKPENLEQFAILGSNYAEHVQKVANPRVALLNIGEEEGKGNLLAKAAYELLKMNPHINFVGNIEGRDLFLHKADVIVCDGYTGNIVLKLAESIYHVFGEMCGIEDEYIRRFNHSQYGGTPVLGINKSVIVAHGISNAIAFEQMLGLAYEIAKSDLPSTLQGKFATA